MDNCLVHVNSCESAQPFGMDDTMRRCREKRCLCCLPIDILLTILSYLSVGDYVSFRSVCKSWQSAFQEYSPLVSQKQNRSELPWFVLLKNSKEEECVLKTTGEIGELSTKRIYNTGIPELCGSRILSSKHGWLLLFSSSEDKGSSLFFLNPFSMAKIEIPLLDVTELTFPFFDTSAPPTWPDCVVFVVCSNKEKGTTSVSTCRRGDTVWQTNSYSRGPSPVVNAVFVDDVLYCLHERGSFSGFDLVTRVWGVITIPPDYLFGIGGRIVSHMCKRGNQVYFCIYGSCFHEVQLETTKMKQQLRVSRKYFRNGRRSQFLYEYTIRSSPEKAFMQMIKEDFGLKVDTFNSRAWCIDFDKNGGEIKFRWHDFQSLMDDWPGINLKTSKCCFPQHGVNNDCSIFIMWIKPIWVHPSVNLSWES